MLAGVVLLPVTTGYISKEALLDAAPAFAFTDVLNIGNEGLRLRLLGDKQPLSSGHFAAPDAIVAHAGGTNVFTDVRDSWIHVSGEEVVARAPEVITVDAADDEQARQMTDFLLGRAELAGLPAITQHRFSVLPYVNRVSGVRCVDSAVALAKFLHG